MKLLLFICAFGLPLWMVGQDTDLDQTLERLNSRDVPYISVEELQMRRSDCDSLLLVDAREKEEFAVSHLAGAYYAGYKKFSLEQFREQFPDKNQVIVVYCSIGVRSENIGQKIQNAGYKRVFNLYGGIFEWKNKGYDVLDSNGQKTEQVHAYSPYWGKFLLKGEKVYTDN